MKKLILILILLIPFNVKAVSIDLFYGSTCPYCHNEIEYLEKIQKQYKDNITINKYEVWHNKKNNKLMTKTKNELNISSDGVPLTIIGKKSITGFNEQEQTKITNLIDGELKRQDTLSFPIIGNINVKNTLGIIQVLLLSIVNFFSLNSLWLMLFILSIFILSKGKNISVLIGMIVSYLIMTLNIIKFNSFIFMVLQAILSVGTLLVGALILNNYINKKEYKDKKIILFILGFIGTFILCSTNNHHLLDISLNNSIYIILYTIIFILLVFIVSKLISILLKKIKQKEILSFIILLTLGVSLALFPSLYIF